MNKRIKQYVNVIVGSSLMTIGIYLFVTPNNLNFGGIIGLAQIIDYFINKLVNIPFDINIVGIINMIINIPLFLMALKIMNKEFCFKTIISLIIQTLLLSLLPPLKAPLAEDLLLNALFGAMICGVGIGITLRGSGSCGGTDIASMCLIKLHPSFKAGQLSIYFNAVLFSICLFIFDLQITMYSILFVVIVYTVSDHFHDQNINVAAIIFTENPEIKNIIMKEMGRGVTFWNGYGAYTNHQKDVLFCAVNKYEISEVKRIIADNDAKAFVTFFEGPMVNGGFEKRL